jgi:murein DD-endopeptidase MepM/ murein hydrolase activator NlpD
VFEKKKMDQVPLTVVANCKTASIGDPVEGKPDRVRYHAIKPSWRRTEKVHTTGTLRDNAKVGSGTRIAAEKLLQNKATLQNQGTQPPAQMAIGRYPVAGTPSHGFGVPWSEKAWKTHTGVDIPARKGTPVLSMSSGRVVKIGNLGEGWGDYLIVEEAGGTAKGYLHVRPSVGYQEVKRGDELGKVYKDHLHYNVCRKAAYCQRGALPTNQRDPEHPNDPLFKDGPFLKP